MTKESVADGVACHGGRLGPLPDSQAVGGAPNHVLGRSGGCIRPNSPKLGWSTEIRNGSRFSGHTALPLLQADGTTQTAASRRPT